MPVFRVALVMMACAACTPRLVIDPLDRLPFAFEARGTYGEVNVIPALALHEPVEPNLDSYVGAALPFHRSSIRALRAQQLEQVPSAVGFALPGEVNGLLGLKWPGQFHDHRIPQASLSRLGAALTGRRPDLHASLAEAAHGAGGEASLFSWVIELEGEPLSLRGFPGEVVETVAGPVVLDHDDEPYLIEAEVGMALVTEDGAVLLRYQDTYHALLSRESTPQDAGRMLARSLAEEVVLVWGTESGMGDMPRRNRRVRGFTSAETDAASGSGPNPPQSAAGRAPTTGRSTEL